MSARFLSTDMSHQADGRLILDDVTLLAVSSVALDATWRAMRQSVAQIRFGAALLLSDRPPADFVESEVIWRQIPRIASRADYSRFIMAEASGHVETDFALFVQWDGYVLDAANWRDDFLDYDYIGAPWPHFSDGQRVGNGGFSLRSKRLMHLCGGLALAHGEAEDVAICRRYRGMLEREHEIRFAPEVVARDFAYERFASTGREFGFHGVINLMRQMAPRDFSAMIAGFEPGAIGRLEAREIFWRALATLRPDIAWLAARNRHLAKRGGPRDP